MLMPQKKENWRCAGLSKVYLASKKQSMKHLSADIKSVRNV